MGHRINTLRNHTLPIFWHFMPRSVLKWLPGTSRAFGPPRSWATLDEYGRSRKMEWRSIFPSRAEVLPPPFFCNRSADQFERVAQITWPETGIAILPNGRILDEHGWIVGDNDTFLGELCYTGNRRHSRVNHIIKLHPPRFVPGRTLNLCSANAVTNFFHYLIDSLSRYDLVTRAGFTWNDFDHIVLPRFSSPMTQRVDAAVGVPLDKVIRMGRREQLVCETLYQPSFPGPIASTPPWIVQFYRNLFSVPTQPGKRRFYFPREGKRSAANAGEIAERMAAHGFETVDPTKTPDIVQLLGEAGYVAGIHGASLANLVFCPPGTRVLEIMPTDISEHYNRAFYYTLCASGEMPYGVVIGQSRRLRLLETSPQSKTPFHVNIAELDRGLEALLSEPPVTRDSRKSAETRS